MTTRTLHRRPRVGRRPAGPTDRARLASRRPRSFTLLGVIALLGVVALPGACQSVAEGTDWRDASRPDVDPDVGQVLTWLPAPDIPTDATLFAAWGREPYDLWVVGSGGTVLHRASAGWEAVAVPTTARLEGVHGFEREHVFAVGEGGVALHRTRDAETGAATWSAEETPTDLDLLDVHGVAPDDLWAVGAEGVVLHRGGDGWERLDTGHYDRLGGVLAFGPDAAVAVGDFGTVLRWDGEAWHRDADVGTARHLNGVWGTGMGDLVAVGLGGAVLRFRDGAWTRLETESASWLRDVWGASWRLVYAVGWDGAILRIQGDGSAATVPATVTAIVPQERHRLEGIYGHVGGGGPNVFFVGAEGSVLVGPQAPASWETP